MALQFKWIDFYVELASKLLEFKQNRNALIEKVRNAYSSIGMKLPKLDTDNNLKDIDPFTVFGLFNKGITGANRISILRGFASEFGIEAEVPDDFSGIPILNNMMATFYAFTGDDHRKDDDIDNLWNVFESALSLAEKDSSDNRAAFMTAFDKVLSQYAVKWNITMALFWVRPYTFINLDSRNRKFLSEPNNISAEVTDIVKAMKSVPSADQYLSLIDKCKDVVETGEYGYTSFPELSHKAYLSDIAKVWLISYNKDKWHWEGFAEKCEGTKRGQTYIESWACTSKIPQIGDEVFLIKLGEQPRGLIGHGTVVSESYEKEHYDSEKAAKGKKENAIDVSFDRLIDYEKDEIISQDELNSRCPEQHWSPQNSGIEIKSEVLDTLYSLWQSITDDEPEDEYWPSLDDYDPKISKEEYKRCMSDANIVKYNNLDTVFRIFQMGGEATCKQLELKFGLPQGHYNQNAQHVARWISNETGCPKLEGSNNSRLWPVLFVGRNTRSDEEGEWVWKLRDSLRDAIKELDSEGFFDNMKKGAEESMNHHYSNNTILYGPPGTGKTYHSVICAVAICDGKSMEDVMKEPYSKVLLRYRELQNDGRIEFTTFHQSYGYEEFIEGIKPILDNESETLGYSIEDGVFKAFCRRAKTINIQAKGRVKIKDNPRIWVMLLGGPGMTSLKEECFSKNEVRIGWTEIEDVDWEDDEIISWRSRQMLYAFTYEMEPGDIVLIEKDSKSIDAIGIIAGDYEYDKSLGSYPRRRTVEWIATNIDENMVQYLPGGRKQLARFTVYAADYIGSDVLSEIINKYMNEYTDNQPYYEEKKEKPYVFIIDEINRGNISKIFGELITLIENTKRAGAPEAMEAVLPYSGESFSVPSNVYILGTMNTADRSIALMDTALRRRFEFTEMMPNPEVLESLGVGTIIVDGEELNVARMLNVINERIEFLFDREHTIGHAFFTKLADDPSLETLAGIFRKNVIPLLQEYFYEDYEKIQLVLGDNAKEDEFKFILDKPLRIKDVFNGNPDIDLPEKGYIVQHEAFFKLESYKQIGREL